MWVSDQYHAPELDNSRWRGYRCAMIDPNLLDDLAKRLSDSVPGGVRAMQDDLRKNIRAMLESTFSRLELVTREEFDAQTAVLARTRQRLEQMEQRVADLETLLREDKGGA